MEIQQVQQLSTLSKEKSNMFLQPLAREFLLKEEGYALSDAFIKS